MIHFVLRVLINMIKIPTCTCLLVLLYLTGCATPLQRSTEPDETAPTPANNALWQSIDDIRQDDWFHLLNTGQEALTWR